MITLSFLYKISLVEKGVFSNFWFQSESLLKNKKCELTINNKDTEKIKIASKYLYLLNNFFLWKKIRAIPEIINRKVLENVRKHEII